MSNQNKEEPQAPITKKQKAYQSKDWVFTQYFDEKWDAAKIQQELPEFNKRIDLLDMTVMKYSLEQCPETGRLHIQGRFTLRFRMTIKGMQSYLKTEGHEPFSWMQIEKDAKKSADYVKKKYTHIAGPFLVTPQPRTTAPRVVEYWYGNPGTGKTTTARKLLQKQGYQIYEVSKADASKGTWMSGYNGEEGVIMDEVDVKWFSEANWKKVLDTTAHDLPAGSGGKNILWEPKCIIMLSNYPPPSLFQTDAFKRRISHIREIMADPYPFQETKHSRHTNFEFQLSEGNYKK